jgi:hypothetical protein
MTGLETGGIVAVVMVLMKLLEKFADYVMKKNGNGTTLSSKEHDMLKGLYDQHNKYDSDGIPIWYVPRGWADTQEKILDIVAKISEDQRRTAEILDRLESRIERMNN